MKRIVERIGATAAMFCAITIGWASADETPQYGGTLEVGTIYVTLTALSFDPYDWNWKLNHDTGQYFEQLFAADLSKAKHRGGKYAFVSDAWIPTAAIRGELAERWEWDKGRPSVIITLRKGIMFPDKPGVMKARELTAEDVKFSFERQAGSPKKIPEYFDFIDRLEVRDKRTIVLHFKEYTADWDYRLGYGFYSAIIPKELVDAGIGNWKNAVGTGPFQLVDFVKGNSQTYVRNPTYWDVERVEGKDYKLPFVDKLVYRTIKDEATQHTALRTGKLDILEAIRWQAVEQLKKDAPQLKWSRWLGYAGTYLAMRVDRKPFDDVRVRRALNMAINKQEIVAAYYGGHAELFAYPMHPDFGGYFQPLSQMPESVKELFTYNPEKAKQLLAQAGYPNGFKFKVQVCSCAADHMDLLPLVAGYLEQVGVKVEIQPMEYGAFLSAMTSKTHAEGYFMNRAHNGPIPAMRTFVTGQTWNPAIWADAKHDAKVDEVVRTRDEASRQKMLREMTIEILDGAPYIWLPTTYVHTAWWPWVKNYGGELRAGAMRPGPIYARLWIDQEMKKKMGY